MSSEYEQNVGDLLSKQKRLLESTDANKLNEEQKKNAINEIETLQSLFENYNSGMNVFRRAKGGRTGLRE